MAEFRSFWAWVAFAFRVRFAEAPFGLAWPGAARGASGAPSSSRPRRSSLSPHSTTKQASKQPQSRPPDDNRLRFLEPTSGDRGGCGPPRPLGSAECLLRRGWGSGQPDPHCYPHGFTSWTKGNISMGSRETQVLTKLRAASFCSAQQGWSGLSTLGSQVLYLQSTLTDSVCPSPCLSLCVSV